MRSILYYEASNNFDKKKIDESKKESRERLQVVNEVGRLPQK